MTRGEFIKGSGLVLGALILGACGLRPRNQETSANTSEGDFSFLEPMIRVGKDLQSADDKVMLDEPPNLDLTYASNPAVRQIRAMADTQARTMATIGWLDVEKSKRYSSGVYTCNVYALDAMRLVLGNDAIGSSYDLDTGALGVRGINEPELPDNFRFLHANNISKFMKDYGVDLYGWKQVSTKAELDRTLLDGSVVMGASSPDAIEKGGTEYIGHSFVLFGVKDNIVLSQSTTNIQAEGHAKGDRSSSKLVPEENMYCFWAHALPNAS
ncbi:MAG: hypothetical protein WCI88_16160 [Chloroflexota bacterium]